MTQRRDIANLCLRAGEFHKILTLRTLHISDEEPTDCAQLLKVGATEPACNLGKLKGDEKATKGILS